MPGRWNARRWVCIRRAAASSSPSVKCLVDRVRIKRPPAGRLLCFSGGLEGWDFWRVGFFCPRIGERLMIKVGVVGGTGYTGVELLRLLAQHPQVELKAITSRGEAGQKVSDMFPSLRGRVDIAFETPQDARLGECDIVFFATRSEEH